MRIFFVSMLALLATACSGHMDLSNEAREAMFTAPDQVLTPTVGDSVVASPVYTVYTLSSAKFAVNLEKGSLSAQVRVESSAGVELVDLVGALRADGSASLFDLNPLKTTGQNRLVGEAYCADMGACSKIILNVYYNVDGKTMHKQFSSEALQAESSAAPGSGAGAAGSGAAGSSGAAAEPVPGESDGRQEWHPTEAALPDETTTDDEKPGEFVGAPRNEVLIGRLWPRSKTPELPPLLTRAEDPSTQTAPPETPVVRKPTRPDSRSPIPPRVSPPKSSGKPASTKPTVVPKPVVKPAPRPATPVAPKRSAQTEGMISRWMREAREWLVPPIKTVPSAIPHRRRPAPAPAPAPAPVKAPVAPKPVVTTKPVVAPKAVVQPPAQLPAPPKAQPSKPTPPAPAPAPAPVPVTPSKPDTLTPPAAPSEPAAPTAPTREQKQRGQTTLVYPIPPAKPTVADDDLEQKIALLEAKLAPLLNVREGGQAQGSYGYSRTPPSSIKNASELKAVAGLKLITITPNAKFGSGMLVSFLENVATYLFKMFNITVYVGDMSKKNGGAYGNGSSHNTHRDGLDADIAWINYKKPLQDSALDSRGAIEDDFNYESTWSFLKLAYRQELVEDAQKSTAVSRVFMSPRVKDGFCSWAKKNSMLDDEENSELMRLVRREKGHHKHFHLSLKCSPHYPLCRNLAGPPPAGPGCAQ